MKTVEQLAESGYKAYVKQAGGVTFDGKPIPTWAGIGAERQACWLACAKEILAQSAALGVVESETSAASGIKPDGGTIYFFDDSAKFSKQEPVTPTEMFTSGSGGDFGGGGASGDYSSSDSSSDSSSSSSE